MTPIIEYVERDRLIYISHDAGRYPIAFMGSATDPVPFMNFTDAGFITSACERAYIYKQPQLVKNMSVVDHLAGDLLKIFNIKTKRVCYFCQEIGMYTRITKVENVKRNNSPENVLGVWNLDTRHMPADELQALRVLAASGWAPMTRFGHYIPASLAKRIVADLRPSESHEPVEKVVVNEPVAFGNSDQINYWMNFSDTSAGREVIIEQYKGDRFVYQIYVGFIENNTFKVYEEFMEAVDVIHNNAMHLMATGRRYHMTTLDGARIYDIHDKLENKSPKTIKPSEPNSYINSEKAIKPLTINARTILI